MQPVSPSFDRADLARMVLEVLQPAHFFLGDELRLEWVFEPTEDDVWEVFQGRLLDRRHTRARQRFAAWNVFLWQHDVRSLEPLLSIKLDQAAIVLHIVRGVEAYVQEAYDAGSGVILTRETRGWVRELCATIDLRRFDSITELRGDLTRRLFHAVIGNSRLPLHSVESPLPLFTFGQLFYCHHEPPLAVTNPGDLCTWLTSALCWIERVKLLEAAIRASDIDAMPALAANWDIAWRKWELGSADLLRLLRTLFNEISLSPYTDFAEKFLKLLSEWEAKSVLSRDEVIDLLGHLLRQLGRHLSAYDLIHFHQRGANYPDALLLDALLRQFSRRIDDDPRPWITTPIDVSATQARKRLRRRALRQGWLLWQRYRAHAVPDRPTSPGEHARVWPASMPRVPEEQILQPDTRSRQLFVDDPLPTIDLTLLRLACADLDHADELRELGIGVFLDRPLGDRKAPAEPDATPLITSTAFSPSLASSCVEQLLAAGLLDADAANQLRERLAVPTAGLSLSAIGTGPRPGMVAQSDARLSAGDFVFQRTLPVSLRTFLDLFDWRAVDLSWLKADAALLARDLQGRLTLYDDLWRPRLVLEVVPGTYRTVGRVEVPSEGLRLAQALDESGGEMPITSREIRPRGLNRFALQPRQTRVHTA